MLSNFRLKSGGVSARLLGITILIAILFVAGCTSGNSEAQLAVTTLSGGLPAGSVSVGGGAYPATTLKASGGTAPYMWAVASGNLPAGLTLSSAGVIAGVPTASGTSTFTVTVTDSATPTPHTATGSLSITINAILSVTTSGTLPTTGEAGAAYSATLAEAGGVGPFTWVLNSGSLPTGLSLGTNGTIGSTISGSAVPGTFIFTAKVTDSQGSVVVSGTISIKVDAALAITPPTFPVGVMGVSYLSPAFSATGGSTTGYTFAVASGTLPASLAINSGTGVISGTPTAAGTSTFAVKVTDSLGFTATTGNLSITINGALAITPPTFPTGIVGTSYPAESFTATGGSGSGYAFTLASGSLPNPASLGANGTIASTTPTVAGTSTFTVKVTDSLGNTFTTGNLSIIIDPILAITPPAFPTGLVGASYPVETFTATGGSASGYTFTLASGALPNPLSLGANGTIAGATPTSSGTFTFTVKVTDSKGFTATSGSLSIVIDPALVITPPTFPTGVVNVSYPAETFTAAGGSGSGYTFTLATGALPNPLSLGANGTIASATPTATGTSTFTVKVTDSLGDTATSASLSITVNGALTITPPAFPTGIVGGTYPAKTFTAAGGSGTGYTFTLASGSLPNPLTLGANGTIASAALTAAGTATFTVKVTDSFGDTVTSGSLSIVVDPALVLTPPTFPTGIVGVSYPAETFTATGGSGSGYTFALASGTLPNPLVLGAGGTIASATPTASGTSSFTVKVTDSLGNTVTTSGLSIVVNGALTITPPSFPSGVVGVSYPAETFTASGGSGSGYTFTLASGALPNPLSLGANGTIASAAPTAAGPSTFTVKVTDSLGNTATTDSLSITINASLAITPPTFPAGIVGGSYPAETFTAVGGSGTGYTYTVFSGALPTPLTLGANGTIASATPTAAGTFTFTVKVTDSLGNTATTGSLSITINASLAITPPTFPAGIVGGSYPAETFTATGGSGTGYTYTLASGALPNPLALGANGTIASATPTASGTSTFTVKVTDSLGNTATTSSLSITINGALTITPPAFQTGIVGASYPAKTFTAAGGSGSGYTYTLFSGSLPSPLSLGANGTIATATPTASGTFTFTVKVTDSLGNTATSTSLSLTIDAALVITPPTFPTGTVGTSYPVESFTTTGGSSTGYTYALASGSLPSPLTLGTNGTIASATPTGSGTFTFTVKVTDSLGFTATSGSLSITVQSPPSITSANNASFTVGVHGTFTVTTTGTLPMTLTETGSLPSPITFVDNGNGTATISGIPSGASVTGITITASNGIGSNATQSFTLSVTAVSCSSNCTISGTVSFPGTASGLPISGLAITLTGPSSANTTTNSSGFYSFAGLTGGNYTVTVTPPLPGYTFGGSPASVVISGNTTTQDFTETPVVTTFSISGLVSYTGAQTGKTLNTIISVFNSGCTGCGNSIAGTSITSVPVSSGTAYTVRGLPPGSYIVNAEIDTQGTAVANSSNPNGSSAAATISTSSLTGVNFTLADRTPATPGAPNAPNIFPSSGAALVVYNEVDDSNNEELATSYVLKYATDAGFTTPVTISHPAGDSQDVFLVPGLTNGTAYYFELAAKNGTGTSAFSPVVGPITINNTSGGNTVSGTVTFTGITPLGRLNVGLYSGNNGVYFVSYPSPTSGQTFSISGVPSGDYALFAFLDQKGCNSICVGNVTNFTGPNGPPQIKISASSSGNAIALTSFNSNVYVTTFHTSGNGNPDNYGVTVGMNLGTELPISNTLYSAPNVGVPLDMNASAQNSYNPVLGNSFLPTVGDPYEFQVTYANGSTQVIPTTVSEVLSTFATGLGETTSGVVGGVTLSRNVPEFTWAAPSPLPTSFYTYEVEVYQDNQQIWFYKGGHDGNGLPSNVTSAVFNSDGKASQSSLTTGTKYAFSVTVTDNQGNSASFVVSYTP